MQVYMGIDFEGPALDLIDEPDMPLFLSTVIEWLISTTERRNKFLCNLDSVIRNVELANRCLEEDEKVEEEEAKQKARNGRKGQAKKAAKQKKKALENGGVGGRQVEGDHDGRSQHLIGQDQLANEAENEELEAQASKDAKGA